MDIICESQIKVLMNPAPTANNGAGPWVSSEDARWPLSRCAQLRLDWLRRAQAARRGSGPPSGQQDPLLQHAKRSRPLGSRAFLLLTRCMSNHRRVCRGVARDGGRRPARAPTFARTPRCLALCWQGARRGDNEDLEAHVNIMLNIFADA